MENTLTSKSAEWIEQTETKIREAFELFDKDKTDTVVQEEIGKAKIFLE